MILICIIINLIIIKNEGEESSERRKMMECYDAGIREEGRRVGGVRKKEKARMIKLQNIFLINAFNFLQDYIK